MPQQGRVVRIGDQQVTVLPGQTVESAIASMPPELRAKVEALMQDRPVNVLQPPGAQSSGPGLSLSLPQAGEAPSATGTPPGGVSLRPESRWEQMEPERALGADVLNLATGLIPNAGLLKGLSAIKKVFDPAAKAASLGPKALTGVRSGLALGTGAIDALSEGGDPLGGGLANAAIEQLSGMAGRGLPKLGNTVGLMVGGVKGDTKPVLEAMERQRQRQSLATSRERAQTLGVKGRTEDAIKSRGQLLGAVEDRLSLTEPETPAIELSHWGSRGSPSVGTAEKIQNTEEGLNLRLAGEQNEYDYLTDLLGTKGNLLSSEIPGFRKNIVDRIKSQGGQLTSQDIQAIEQYITQRGGKATRSVKELGEHKRELSKEAEDLIRARVRGDRVASGDKLKLQMTADRSRRAKELQYSSDPQGELEPINKELGDLFTILEAQKALKGGGGYLQDVGRYGVQGGLSQGVISNINRATGGGIDPQTSGLMTLIGTVLLNPRYFSAAGNAGGQIGDLIASIVRGVETTGSAREVKRKDPK